MALEGTVKVPGIGPVKKQKAVYGGLGAVAFVLAIWWYRQRKASSAKTTSATGGTQTDPAGNVGVIDPATGYVQGSAEDTAALASLQGTGTAYDTGQLGGGSGLSGYYYGAGGSTQPVPPGPGNFADNAEWAQYAGNYLISTLGGDPGAVGTALGLYINSQAIDPAQQNIVHEAIAFAGAPPQAGPGGDPPGIKTTTSGKPPPPPPGHLPAPTGLKVTSVWSTGADIHWNPVPGATGYSVGVVGQAAVDVGNTTYHGIGGLKPKTHYTVNVAGKPSSSGHASVSFTTK